MLSETAHFFGVQIALRAQVIAVCAMHVLAELAAGAQCVRQQRVQREGTASRSRRASTLTVLPLSRLS